MGTPDFALFTLRALCDAGENVVGVVTQPDKPKGRGYAMQPPPVKVFALERGLPVYQPETLRGGAFDDTLAALAPDVIVVVAYGKILPKSVLEYPKHGCINVHGSLLPAYRGAAPMQRAILEGCSETGVTTMQMAEGLDTGDMLIVHRVPIGENDTLETIHDTLGAEGAVALLETLDAIRAGTLVATKQDESRATYAAKITKEDCLLDFTKSARCVHDRVRALSPVPLTFTHTPDGKLLKVIESRCSTATTDAAPGTVIALGDCIAVACGEGSVIELRRVLPEGKGRMSAADYNRGRRLSVGDVLK
jgi:methionyl-tRNA formyltransferase